MVEWDPYTIPIIAESDGIAYYVDLTEGVSLREVVDEMTGITKRVVVDWQQTTYGKNLQPRIILRDKKDKQVKLPSGGDARYLLAPDTAAIWRVPLMFNFSFHAKEIFCSSPKIKASKSPTWE